MAGPRSDLEREKSVIGPKTPRAEQYIEALKKRDALKNRQMQINAAEKLQYDLLPKSENIYGNPATDPKLNQYIQDEYIKYKNLQNTLKENFNQINPEIRENTKDKIDEIENFLVQTGKLQKA
jgi:hypothetical protein